MNKSNKPTFNTQEIVDFLEHGLPVWEQVFIDPDLLDKKYFGLELLFAKNRVRGSSTNLFLTLLKQGRINIEEQSVSLEHYGISFRDVYNLIIEMTVVEAEINEFLRDILNPVELYNRGEKLQRVLNFAEFIDSSLI